jgi:ribosome-binding protein aMBF1 (putative translation factor)
VPTNADLGQAIRRLRWDRDLSIEDLAHTAKMHPTFLGRIERGRASPTWGKLVALAVALGVSMVELAQHAEDEAVVARAASAARLRLREGSGDAV